MAEDSLPQGETTSLLIITMAMLWVRNTMLEDIHAGPVPVAGTGDYSDATAIDSDGNRIAWTPVSPSRGNDSAPGARVGDAPPASARTQARD